MRLSEFRIAIIVTAVPVLLAVLACAGILFHDRVIEARQGRQVAAAEQVLDAYRKDGWRLYYDPDWLQMRKIRECRGADPERHPCVTELPSTEDLICVSDSGLIASLDGARVAIWKRSTGERVGEVPLPAADVMALSPDGQLVAVYEKGLLRGWDRKAGKDIFFPLLQIAPDQPHPIAWNRDGTQLACTTTELLLDLVDVATGVVRTLGPGTSPAWSGDGRAIACVEPGSRRIWLYDVDTGGRRMLRDEYETGRLAWTPDDRYVCFIGAALPKPVRPFDPIARHALRLVSVADGSLVVIPQCSFPTKGGPSPRWNFWWSKPD